MANEVRDHHAKQSLMSGRGILILPIIFACFSVILLAAATRAAQGQSKWADMLPDAPGKEIISKNCQLCHTLERVVTSHREKAEWEDLVSQMVDRGCPIDDKDVPAAISYLAASFGLAEKNPPATPAGSAQPGGVSGGSPNLVVDPDHVQFQPIPDALAFPKSVQVFTITGDPTRPGAFSVLLKVPAGQVIPAHWGPADESVVVLKGSFEFAEGNDFDAGKLQALKSGAVLHIPPQTHIFGRAKEDAVLMVSGSGPLMFAGGK
ncbi:MAG: cupin domain-containing protein [Candidatus Acidiferrales bacterium]|jgi:quercetin dioxygenase-like cupin family protein